MENGKSCFLAASPESKHGLPGNGKHVATTKLTTRLQQGISFLFLIEHAFSSRIDFVDHFHKYRAGFYTGETDVL